MSQSLYHFETVEKTISHWAHENNEFYMQQLPRLHIQHGLNDNDFNNHHNY